MKSKIRPAVSMARSQHRPYRRCALALALLLVPLCAHAEPLVVYDDALRNGFVDWSWATHNLQATNVVHSGTYAISMTPANWTGLYFHSNGGFSAESNGILELWVHGGSSGGQQIRLYLYSALQPIANAELEGFIPGGMIPANQWAKATIPFSVLGVTSDWLDGLVLQTDGSGTQPTLYFDDLVLLDTAGPPPPLTVAVDPEADRRDINPLIYGVNFGNASEFGALPYPLRRWGGNAVTRYNWQKDASNRGSDWFFMNLPDGADSTNLPNGSAADLWLDETRLAGAEPILTVPTIGWTARDRVKRWGFSVAKYGPQQETECTVTGWPSWCEEDAGNGVWTNGSNVTGNDPHDTSIEVGPPFAQGWLQYLVGRYGSAQAGGLRYYALDNEPMLWNSTHRDVHPAPVNLDELWARTLSYAEACKQVDPGAQILGPTVWGWCAFFYSAADGCTPGPDMAAHGGLPLLEWYLLQNRQRELQTGVRPVDLLDVHYYPQASGVALTDNESVAAVRLRSLKGLYDPNYVDESWIGQPVRLIPRLREWIDARCPGMGIALTEYNWGGDEGISSALAQAEALAIFGREGVDLATRWVAPAAGSKVLEAFRLYLDYDGAGHDLDGESVRAISSNVDEVGAYAIRTGEGEVALLLFNKAAGAREPTVTVAGALDGPASLYRFDASNDLGPAGQVTVAAGGFTVTLPGRSATLVRVPLAESSAVDLDPDGESQADNDRLGRNLRLEARPSPFRTFLDLTYDLPEAAPVTWQLVDVGGRIIRRGTSDGPMAPGRHQTRVDLAADGGREVPGGVYRLRVEAGGRRATRTVVHLD